MIHPIRRIHAWAAGFHAWWYLGSARFEEGDLGIPTAPTAPTRAELWARPGKTRPERDELIAGSLFNQLRHMSSDERDFRTSDIVPDTQAVAFMAVPPGLHRQVFGATPKRLQETMVALDDAPLAAFVASPAPALPPHVV